MSEVLNYALEYLKLGLSVIPLQPREKRPLIKWKQYQQRLPTEDEVRKWFSKWPNANIGIVCGRVSGNLLVLDFDSEDLYKQFMEQAFAFTNLYNKLKETWIVRTGKGVHIYFRVKDVTPPTKLRLKGGIDLKGEGGYVVAPPSIHPSGKRYEFVNGGPGTGVDIATLDKEEFNLLLSLIEEKEEEKEGGKDTENKEVEELEAEAEAETKQEGPKELTDEQINAIAKLLVPYWKKGHRNNLAMYLLGTLYKAGVAKESARKIIEVICRLAEDEEIRHRLYLVDYHYGPRIEDLIREGKEYKGVAGLRKELEEVLKKHYRKTEEEAALEAARVVEELLDILQVRRSKIPTDVVMSIIEHQKDRGIVEAFVNDLRRGIVKVRYRVGERWEPYRYRYVTAFAIKDVLVIVNPLTNDRTYRVTVFYPRLKFERKLPEMTLPELVGLLKGFPGVKKKSDLDDAVSSLLEAFEAKGRATVEERVPATGFFEVRGELKFYVSDRAPVNLPSKDEYDSVDVVDALEALDKIASYFRPEVFSTVIAWGVVAPLFYVRKQHHRIAPMLLLYGEPQVGKSTLGKIILAIWGVERLTRPFYVTGAFIASVPRLGEIVDATTLPIVCNEVRSVLDKPDVSDALKNLATELIVRGRTLTSQGGMIRIFNAYASMYMTTNFVPPMDPGLRERCIMIEMTLEDKPSEEKKEEFAEVLDECLPKLKVIGAFLRDTYTDPDQWPKIREYLLRDPVELGRMILRAMYEKYLGRVPDWVDAEFRPEPEEEDLIMSAFLDVVREALLEAAQKLRLEIQSPLDVLPYTSALPSWIRYDEEKDEVIITSGVIREMKRRKGIEVAGGLKNLALHIGADYTRRRIGNARPRVIVISRAKLEQLLSGEAPEEETENTEEVNE